MARTRKRYPLEYRRKMVELVRAGRTPEELSREFEPSAGAIRNWVEQMDQDEGLRLREFLLGDLVGSAVGGR